MKFLFFNLFFLLHNKYVCKIIKYYKINKNIIDKWIINVILNFGNEK